MTLMDRTHNTERRARSVARQKNKAAFLIGVGSLIDLRGLDTYRAARTLTPPRAPKTMSQVTKDVTRLMSIRYS